MSRSCGSGGRCSEVWQPARCSTSSGEHIILQFTLLLLKGFIHLWITYGQIELSHNFTRHYPLLPNSFHLYLIARNNEVRDVQIVDKNVIIVIKSNLPAFLHCVTDFSPVRQHLVCRLPKRGEVSSVHLAISVSHCHVSTGRGGKFRRRGFVLDTNHLARVCSGHHGMLWIVFGVEIITFWNRNRFISI